MSTITNVTRAVSITSGNFNMAATKGIDYSGHWFIYLPVNANNDTLLADIDIYQWDTNLPIVSSATTLEIEGTIALISETWAGSTVKYHGSCIEDIGPGTNDITDAIEDDAFKFAHLGSLSTTPDDDAFYWDRAFLPDGTSNWDYYQYHKHLPTSYPVYENGRSTFGAGLYINPSDKSFGYMIQTRIKVSGVFYQSILARVHTPSVGGAHNSHNDVTLPSSTAKNYMAGGILKGSGERFHAFYITANGTEWDVFVRTFVNASASFTVEVNLGKFNLGDPTFTVGTTATSGDCSNFPVRASAGDLLGTKIYIPVIMTNSSNSANFDLEVWSFNSADTIAGGSLSRTVLISNSTIRPDCHLLTVGDSLYALATDLSSGGLKLFVYSNNAWNSGTLCITNSTNSNNALRVHGLKYNTSDVKFYALVSGTAASGAYNYTGPGLYTFKVVGDFAGYKHLDYDNSTNSFISRGPLTAGYLDYTVSDGTIKRNTNTEPEGIAASQRILKYEPLIPNFFNRSDLSLGGDEYIYHGIFLKDGRKLLAGKIENHPYGDGSDDLLLSIMSQDNQSGVHFAWGGNPSDTEVNVNGDDYFTAAFQSTSDPNKVWFTGYTKSELVEKKDMILHGYCRSMIDPPNLLQWNDTITDSDGNIYLVGTNSDGYANVAKYNSNYIIQWQKQLGNDEDAVVGNSITLGGNYIYIIGTNNSNAVVGKFDLSGNEIWIKSYGTAGTETGTGIAYVTKNNVGYLVFSIVGTTSTIIVVSNTDGDIIEQNSVSNLVVEKIRDHQSTADGTFLFAGSDGAGVGKIGLGIINQGSRMVRWTSTYGDQFNDIKNIDAGPTYGYVAVGSDSTYGIILKVTVTESSGSYTVSKSWARKLTDSTFKALHVSPHTDSIRYAYTVGSSTTGGSAAMGMDEGVIAKYDNNGTNLWANVFGHDMDESINGVTIDFTGNNLVVCGWSESHSTARDSILFRCPINGFATGVYHLHENAGIPYYYLDSTLTDSSDTGTLTNLTAPADSAGTAAYDNGITFNYVDSAAEIRIFDGSYGANGTFMLHFGYLNLSAVQEYLNSDEYRLNQSLGRPLNYTKDIFTFYQISTVGDGTADDGNVFGYDIIETSNGMIYIIGQTSGDLEKTNQGTSGVYDYILIKFNPNTEEVEIYQNGTSLDEETYALCELSNGKIAFTGRTTGDLGDTNIGGYDIFLGIYNPTNDTFVYDSFGTGLDDKGVNLHDVGNNQLAIVFSTYGSMGDSTVGSEDIGIVYYNYNTNTWGTAYQTGTTGADIFEQNGKPSAQLADGRIAVIFSTALTFDQEDTSYGFLDMALAVFDPVALEWTKKQIGAQSSDSAHSVDASGERLLICGHSSTTFGSGGQGIYVEADVQVGFGGKAAA